MSFNILKGSTLIASTTNDGIPYLWKSGDITTTPSNETKITASDGAANDHFGNSVAVGCGRIVVGASLEDANGSSSGSAYIFDLDGTQLAKIKASDGAATDYFGYSVAVGSGIIVVGARGDDDNGSDSGSAYIFDLDGTQLAKITPFGGAAGDYFGTSVAVGSDRIVVGAYNDDDNGSNSGSAYIFDLDGTQLAKITASDGAATDYFGSSVAVGSGRIVVGARNNDDDGSNSGSAYIFDLNGTQLAKITASDAAAGDLFGYSVAAGSGRIVVGAASDDDNGSSSGSAYIFDLDGNQLAKITASDGAAGDLFGFSVAVGSGRIVVGASDDDDNGSDSGSVYIFDLDGTQLEKITASDGAATDYFGYSVAAGCSRIVVGAELDDDNGSDSGSAYIYETPQVHTLYDALDLQQSRLNLSPDTDSIRSSLVLACPFNGIFGYSDMSSHIRGSGNSLTVYPHSQGTSIINSADHKFYGSSVLGGTNDAGVATRIMTSGFTGFGNGDFTIEYWIRIPDFGSQSFSPLWYQDGNGDGLNNAINFTDANPSYHGEISVFINSTSRCKTTTRIAVDTWTHVAIEKYNGYIYIYHNGVNRSTQQSSVPSGDITSTTALQLLTGFDNTQSTTRMQDLRIYVGVAKYTGGATPRPPEAMFVSTKPDGLYRPSPYTDGEKSSLVLACPFSKIFGLSDVSSSIRGSGVSYNITGNDASFDTTVNKFYNSSVKVGSPDGSTVRIETSTSIPAFGSNDFCIESWLYVPSIGTNNISIFYHHDGTDAGFRCVLLGSGSSNSRKMVFSGGAGGQYTRSNDQIPLNQWFHFACTRFGSTLRLFINGTSNIQTGGTVSGNFTVTRKAQLFVQADTTYNTIRAQDFRVYQGAAKYISNFTPPGAMFT